jgi:hypothetical protein
MFELNFCRHFVMVSITENASNSPKKFDEFFAILPIIKRAFSLTKSENY